MGNFCSGEKPITKPQKRYSQNSILNPLDKDHTEDRKLYEKYLYPTILTAIRNNEEKNEIFISLRLPTYSNNNYKEFLEIINSGIYSNKVITVVHLSEEEVILTLEI